MVSTQPLELTAADQQSGGSPLQVRHGKCFDGLPASSQSPSSLVPIDHMTTMDRDLFAAFARLMIERHELPFELNLDQFFRLCNGSPGEARAFSHVCKSNRNGNNSAQDPWSPTVLYALFLLCGGETRRAPPSWIKSALLNGLHECRLVCPAAHEALKHVIRQNKSLGRRAMVYYTQRHWLWSEPRDLVLAFVAELYAHKVAFGRRFRPK